MPPLHHSLVALLAAVALAVSAGCDPDEPASTATTAPPEPTSTAPTTTTTAPPPKPGRIIVAGDSVIFDAAPALGSLLGAERAEVVGLVAPALTRPAMRALLASRAAEAPTDLVVVMVGIWERAYLSPTGAALGDPGWEEAYVTEVLEPVRGSLAGTGAHLLLLRPPPMRDTRTEQDLTALGAIWQRYAATHPDTVTYADTAGWFDGPGFKDLLPDPMTGELARARRVDGTHLCETGARRLAAGIESLLATTVQRPLPVPVGAPSPDLSWTSRFPADECPPVTG